MRIYKLVNDFLATVVIPVHNRDWQLERAIDSILKQNGADKVEIIVVDDASNVAVKPKNLRDWDQVIRLDLNVGAAVCRNVGIRHAKGRTVYLLDSDDYFLVRDFVRDSTVVESGVVYFCDISSQGYKSEFPSEICAEDYFSRIFYYNKFLAQTSSLCFLNSGLYFFDESLPKHQDWDFIFFQVLLAGGAVKHIDGEIYFDRADQGSISRTSSSVRSRVWYSKIANSNLVHPSLLPYIHYNLFCRSSDVSMIETLVKGFGYVCSRKLHFQDWLKILYRRGLV